MPYRKSQRVHRPRELRRRALVPARMRLGSSWSDACILNISSGGLLVHASTEPREGSLVELRRGDHVIRASVVWRSGPRIGLRAQDRLPVEGILSQATPELQLTASGYQLRDRRKRPRSHAQSRMKARAMEFAGVVVLAVGLSIAGLSMVEQAFARPIRLVTSALGG